MKRSRQTLAIAVSGQSAEHDRALAAGFHRCVLKPVDLAQLAALVANLAIE